MIFGVKHILLSMMMLSLVAAKAQYVILDPNSFTNIHKEPDAKSEIVGKVQQYQIFYAEEDIPCNNGNLIGIETNNWLPITTDMKTFAGYIYKPNLLALEDFTVESFELTESIEKDKVISIKNGKVELSLTLGKYDSTLFNNKSVESPMYGTNGQCPTEEIKKMSIKIKGKLLNIDKNSFNLYYQPYYFRLYVGAKNEVYLLIAGGDGTGGYKVILSIVNGKIKYSLPIQCQAS